MFKNINFIVTNSCNGRCTNCCIWKSKNKNAILTSDEVFSLFSKKEFMEVKEVGISGGEPFLRTDLCEVLESIIKALPKAEKFYFTTNATLIDAVLKVCQFMTDNKKNMYLGISLDGDKETNKSIRILDTFDNAIKLVRIIKETYPSIYISFSFTACHKNCYIDELNYMKKLANELGCGFTLRIAEKTEYYNNIASESIDITENQRQELLSFLNSNDNDLFLEAEKEFLETGKNNVLLNKKTKRFYCPAGRLFAFIQSNGDIYQCIYSNKKIGDKNGLYKNYAFDLTKKCPCMTECAIWPVLIEEKGLYVD